MGKTDHLTKSKVAKFDEFYTPRESVEKEIGAYVEADPDVFRDKVVYLPADRTTGEHTSAFWEYFKENFVSLGLRKLIATCYKSVAGGDGDPEHGERATLTRSAEGEVKETHTLLEGDGDFRSYEQHSDFLEADVVITNPPFSRLKDLLEMVTLLDKEFLLVVPLTAINYRRTFQLIWKKRAWFGTTAIKKFLMRNEDGTLTPVSVQTLWLTNLYHEAERKRLAPLRTMAENREQAKGKACEEILYKRYDNYDAIEVSRLEYIPTDYQGTIGVPITVLPYIARPIKGTVKEEARAAHRKRQFTPSEWERLWKPKGDPFYTWGLVDTQMTRAARQGRMRDYFGLSLEGKIMFTRIILQMGNATNLEHTSPAGRGGVACCAPTKTGNAHHEGASGDHLFDFYTHTHTHNSPYWSSELLHLRQQTAESREQRAESREQRADSRECSPYSEWLATHDTRHTTHESPYKEWRCTTKHRIALRGMAKSYGRGTEEQRNRGTEERYVARGCA